MANERGIGIIGCGSRLRGLARRLLKQYPRLKVVGLFDPRAEAIEESRNELNPDAAAYEDYHDLVKDPRIEWVMIGSWNCFHREQAVAAFEAGKHVFCEKPLATNLEDCLAMREAWQKSGCKFSIGFTLRYSPHYRKIKELLESGAIGQVISLEFNETLDFSHGGYIMADWRRLTSNSGTHMLEKCCHDIDLVNWMLESNASRVASFGGINIFRPENSGLIEKIGTDKQGRKAFHTWLGSDNENPFTSDKDIRDNQVAIIEYENEVRATFHTNCSAAIPERRMYICGTEGAIRADVRAGRIEFRKTGFDEEIQVIDTGVSSGHGGGDDPLIQSLGESITNKVEPVTSLEDGLNSAVTVFAIDEAEKTGRTVSLAPYWQKVCVK